MGDWAVDVGRPLVEMLGRGNREGRKSTQNSQSLSSNASLAILFSSWEVHRLTILLVVVGDVGEEIVNELIIAYSYFFCSVSLFDPPT